MAFLRFKREKLNKSKISKHKTLTSGSFFNPALLKNLALVCLVSGLGTYAYDVRKINTIQFELLKKQESSFFRLEKKAEKYLISEDGHERKFADLEEKQKESQCTILNIEKKIILKLGLC